MSLCSRWVSCGRWSVDLLHAVAVGEVDVSYERVGIERIEVERRER